MDRSAIDGSVALDASTVGVARSIGLLVAAAVFLSACATGGLASGSAPEEELRRVRAEIAVLRADVAALRAAVASAHAGGDRAVAEVGRTVERQAHETATRMDALVAEVDRLSAMLGDVTARVDAVSSRVGADAATAREQERLVIEGIDALAQRVGRLTGSLAGLEARVVTLQQDVSALPPATAPDRTPPTGRAAAPPDPASLPAASAAPAPPTLATGPPPAVPAAPMAGARGDGPPPAHTVPAPTGQRAVVAFRAQDIYDNAYIDFSRGSYLLAIGGFSELLRRFPDDALAANAQYWIGESHLGLARSHENSGDLERAADARRQAAEELAKVVELYPPGDKAPVALYREALTLLELGETEQARERLQRLVDTFPHAAESRLAREQLSPKSE